MPMVFTAAGLLLGPAVLGVLDVRADDEVVSLLAEVTLAVVLFTDASRMDLRTVLREHDLALRLLGLGLPLAIAVGTVVGVAAHARHHPRGHPGYGTEPVLPATDGLAERLRLLVTALSGARDLGVLSGVTRG